VFVSEGLRAWGYLRPVSPQELDGRDRKDEAQIQNRERGSQMGYEFLKRVEGAPMMLFSKFYQVYAKDVKPRLRQTTQESFGLDGIYFPELILGSHSCGRFDLGLAWRETPRGSIQLRAGDGELPALEAEGVRRTTQRSPEQAPPAPPQLVLLARAVPTQRLRPPRAAVRPQGVRTYVCTRELTHLEAHLFLSLANRIRIGERCGHMPTEAQQQPGQSCDFVAQQFLSKMR